MPKINAPNGFAVGILLTRAVARLATAEPPAALVAAAAPANLHHPGRISHVAVQVGAALEPYRALADTFPVAGRSSGGGCSKARSLRRAIGPGTELVVLVQLSGL